MPTLPPAMLTLPTPFAPLFARRVWHRALVLVAETIIAPASARSASPCGRWCAVRKHHRPLASSTILPATYAPLLPSARRAMIASTGSSAPSAARRC